MMIRLAYALSLLLVLLLPSASHAQSEVNPVPKLLKNLDSADERISSAAARSLGTIFRDRDTGSPDSKSAIEALQKKLAVEFSSRLRLEAAHSLGQIRARSSLDSLTGMLVDDNPSVSLSAANAIGRILPAQEAAHLLKGVGVANPTEAVLLTVHSSLAHFAGPNDVAFLLAGMGNKNWRIQVEALRGLEGAVRRGARLDSEVYTTVAGLLDNDVANLANQATHFLAQARTTEALNTLITAVEAKGDGGPNDRSWRTRAQALQALHRIGMPRMSPALPAVIRQLADPTTNVVNEVHRIFRSINDNEKIPRDYLTPLLVTELENSASIGLSTKIMAQLGNSVHRQYASRVATAASKVLAESIKDPKRWEARTLAIHLLGTTGNTADVAAIAGCVGDDVANVRQAAGGALQKLGKLVSEEERSAVVPVLLPFLVSTHDWRKTAVAAGALSAYPSTDLVKPMVKLLSHDVSNVQSAAARTLRTYAASDNQELSTLVNDNLLPVLTANKSCWEYGAQVLGVLPVETALPILIKMLKEGTWRTQENAARSVNDLAGHNRISSQPLSEALIRNTQSNIRQVQESANLALRLLTAQHAAR